MTARLLCESTGVLLAEKQERHPNGNQDIYRGSDRETCSG